MGIHDNWNDFKDPVKQVGRNLKQDFQDHAEESRNKHTEANKQADCEYFYCPDYENGDKLQGITKTSPCLSVKTNRGIRKVTFGVEAFKINEGDPYESLYVDYTALKACPALECSNKRPQRVSGIVWIVIFGILGIVFTKWLLIGCLFGLYKFIAAPVVATLKFFLQENKNKCTYVLAEMSLNDCYAILNYVNEGISTNIRYYNALLEKSNYHDDDLADSIKYLENLQAELLATYSDQSKQ